MLLTIIRAQIISLASSEDGKYLSCGYADGVIELWDIEAALSSNSDGGFVGSLFSAFTASHNKLNSVAQQDANVRTLTGHIDAVRYYYMT